MHSTFLDEDALRLTTRIECGRGQNISRVAPRHYRLELDGDRPGYADYFHVRVDAPGPGPDITIDVLSDPQHGGFPYPSGDCVWTRRLPGPWKRHTRIALLDPAKGDSLWALRVTLPIPRPGQYSLANMVPLPCSELTPWLLDASRRQPDRCRVETIGHTFRRRPILAARIGLGPKPRPAILVIAGHHPCEFPGQWAALGVIEFLLSAGAAAQRVLRTWDAVVIPQVSPDGAALGRACFNAKGQEVYSSYEAAAQGKPGAPAESRAVWRLCRRVRPAAYLEFHGWESATDGAYAPHVSCLSSPDARTAQFRVVRAMTARTRAIEHFGYIASTSDQGISWAQIARAFNAPSFMYEPSMARGVAGCKRTGAQVFRTLAQAIA